MATKAAYGALGAITAPADREQQQKEILKRMEVLGHPEKLGRDGFPSLGIPRIFTYNPHHGPPGTKLSIFGRNLFGAHVMLGGRPATVLSSNARELTAEVPRFLRPGVVDLLVWNRFGDAEVKNAFKITPAPVPAFFKFTAPVNAIVKPSLANQKFLVLMVLPADGSLPTGLTEANMQADLTAKLSGPGMCANGFWSEASYGKTSFVFDVYDHVIHLDENKFDCFHPATPKRIDGVGATYPVTWAGGENLTLAGASSFTVNIVFAAGSHTLSDVVSDINNAIALAWTPGTEAPIVATENAGQLRLESGAEGAAAVLDVTGGTAVSELGLSGALITPGIDGLDERYNIFVEAMTKRTEGMTDANAQAYLGQFAGVIVSYAVSDGFSYYRANEATWTLNVRGGSFEMGTVYITCGYPWQVFAHEIGHTLGLPDLYDEPGPPDLVGEELGNWDIMAGGWGDCHPSAWNKAVKTWKPGSTEAGYTDPWMPGSTICAVSPPPPMTNIKAEALILPINAKMPAINPFAASHPGTPLVHAMRIDFDSNHALFVEAREKGPFVSATIGNATYDTEIPAEGVIVTDAINDFSGVPIYRAYDTLLTPYGNPLDIIGEKYDESLTPTSKLSIACNEVIGSNPAVYRVEVKWGPGSFFDLRIDPWSPPPWESRDIWVDTQVDNDWDEFSHSDPAANPDVAGYPVGNGDRLRVGWPARVYARVWNDGDKDATNVKVNFSIVVPAGTGPGVSIGSDTIPAIPAGSFRLAMVEWTPASAPESHVCVQAAIEPQTGELNVSNNVAQENLTDWYLEGASPFQDVEVPFQVQNPLGYRAHFRVQANGLKPGYSVEVKPVDFWLGAGETTRGMARLHAEPQVGFEQEREKLAPKVSLSFQVLYGCMWTQFGGFSGVAHTVRKTKVEAHTRLQERHDVMVSAYASSDAGPVRGRNVTVRVQSAAGETVNLARGKTDNTGNAHIPLDLPGEYPRSVDYRAEVLLSPGPGTGPAETELLVRFPK